MIRLLLLTLAGYAAAAPGLNLGWASASGGSTAAGVISNSNLGADSFSIAHGGNSVYGNGGNAGTVRNTGIGQSDKNFGWASSSGGSAAAGVISNSNLGPDSFSIAHGGNSVYGNGGNAGTVINTGLGQSDKNFGWASSSGGSTAAGVISNSNLGAGSFSIAHGGNSVYGQGGKGGNVVNVRIDQPTPEPECTPLGKMLNKFISIGC